MNLLYDDDIFHNVVMHPNLPSPQDTINEYKPSASKMQDRHVEMLQRIQNKHTLHTLPLTLLLLQRYLVWYEQ